MRYIAMTMIKIYQKTISLDHGIFSKISPVGACRFKPTCSQYNYQAIKKYGLFKGGFMGLKRILRCHPFNKGGHDPVP